jgi:thiamine-phosphate diphosphorylase
MAERCRDAGAIFLVNDRADVAVLSGAHGVHVGQDDLPVEAARRLAGEGVVGVSTHTQDQVRVALQTTADYLAIGPVFDTTSKGRDAGPVVGLSGVRDARQTIASGKPLVAIGGITLDLAPSVMRAGASSVAVISDLLAPDWRTRARDYLRVLCL